MVVKYKGHKKQVKTIEDALSILNGKTKIAIGSKTAYYFIGTLADYWRHTTVIEAYYRDKHEKLRRRKPKTGPFKSFNERKVLGMHIRHVPDEPKILAIYVEGTEIGEQWFLSEYERLMHKYYRAQIRMTAGG